MWPLKEGVGDGSVYRWGRGGDGVSGVLVQGWGLVGMGGGGEANTCSTYLGPQSVGGRDERRGALLHQIGEVGVAGETVAGGRAPPPLPVFLRERDREGAGPRGSRAVIDR